MSWLSKARAQSTLLLASPLIRRLAWYGRRVASQFDRRFFLSLFAGVFAFVVLAAILITLFEKAWTIASLFDAVNWGVATVLGAGSPEFVVSPGGRVVSWLLTLFGVAILGTITGALVALVIDFLLKEGQGLGASGYRDHIVVCGWNSTARDLISELRGDDYRKKLVVVFDADKNPAGDGVYFVKGDPSEPTDLRRAGIEEAAAAVVFPTDDSNDADMRSILVVMAIEAVAPDVRTVVEVNNPRHIDHFRRAKADEILVTSTLASHLLARSALCPGLTELVTDIVSGGRGSELYRVTLPDDYVGLSIDEVSARLRAEHHATCCRSGDLGRRTRTRRPTSGWRTATTRSSWPSRWVRSRRCASSRRRPRPSRPLRPRVSREPRRARGLAGPIVRPSADRPAWLGFG